MDEDTYIRHEFLGDIVKIMFERLHERLGIQFDEKIKMDICDQLHFILKSQNTKISIQYPDPARGGVYIDEIS